MAFSARPFEEIFAEEASKKIGLPVRILTKPDQSDPLAERLVVVIDLSPVDPGIENDARRKLMAFLDKFK